MPKPSRITLERQVARINDLIERAFALPEKDQRFALKFVLSCLAEQNRIGGLHQVNINQLNRQDIKIEFIPVDAKGREQTIDVPLIEEDPAQLPIHFPSAEPVVYTPSEVFDPDNDLSDELPFDLPKELPNSDEAAS